MGKEKKGRKLKREEERNGQKDGAGEEGRETKEKKIQKQLPSFVA